MAVAWMKRGAVLAASLGAIVFGLVAPAFGEGHFQSYMDGWRDGNSSRDWSDLNLDGTDTRATFHDCTREFRARIRKHNLGPDTTMAEEWINCKSYADAVRAGDVPKDGYHFDIQGMGAVCHSGQCTPRETSVDRVDVYW